MKPGNRPEANRQNGNKTGDGAGKPVPGLAARLVATSFITRVVYDGRNLDALSDASHGERKYLDLSAADRALARAIAITALRHRNQIEGAINRLANRKPPKNARFLISSIHAAAAQILFMDVPDSAAVNVAVAAIKADERTSRFTSFANAVLRRMTREKDKLLTGSVDVSPFPRWFAKRLATDYGKKKAAEIAGIVMRPARVDVTTKSDAQKWAEKLDGKVVPLGSVRLRHEKPVRELSGYAEGEWWVQDAAACIPAKLLNLKSGSDVLELCAAPGGKTAQLVNAGFQVTALDISKPRLKRLEENLDRLGFEAELVEADILEWQAPRLFDAVLLDAPCSSTGTIRRHPDVLWSKREEEIRELAELQFKLICKANEFLKPGGLFVFSNCSLMKEEGENLLSRILHACPDLTLDPVSPEEIAGMDEMINGQGAVRSMPYHMPDPDKPEMGGVDGFFACRFLKA